MRIYKVVLDERATLVPSAKSEKLIEEAEFILPERLPDRMIFDGHFQAWSEESKTAPFPPKVTTIGNMIDCYVMDRLVSNSIAERMGADVQKLAVETSEQGVDYDLVHPCGELVPIDKNRATVRRFRSADKVRAIDRYAFELDRVGGRYLFRASLKPHVQLCTDEFRSDALKYGWKPLIFVPVWDSEHEPFAHTPDRDEIASRPEIYGPKGFKSVPERLMPKEWLSG